MTDSIALRLEAVDKIYRPARKAPVHAVKSLSMEIKAGEIVALLGSSGCGKTSTLRMIAGFEGVSAGTISLAGRRIDPLPPARRGVAMAFEGYSLYPPLTLRDNIAFALKAQRLDTADANARVESMAKLVEIDAILDRYPSSVSGGQQQRASLARALVRAADLYLLDEPMGQLEPQLRAILRGRIKALLKERGMTAIFVTHDQTEANALADRIAVMEGGELQQFANQQNLKDRPENLFVATFIGEPPMNVFEARYQNGGATCRFEIEQGPALEYPASEMRPAVLAAIGRREKVTIGIRPHRVRIGEGPHRARVVSNQWLGDQTHVAAEVGGKLLVAVAHDRVAERAGAEVPFRLAASDLHVFDAETGRALSHGPEAA